MKKIVFTLAATVLIAGFLFTSCNSPSQRVKNAEDNVRDKQEAVIDAKIDLTQARRDTINEYQQFKSDYQNQIRTNERTIAELRANTANASQENKVRYEKNLAELEERNNELKIELAEYREEGKDQWQTFKTEFKSDMDELGKEFSDFTIRNKK